MKPLDPTFSSLELYLSARDEFSTAVSHHLRILKDSGLVKTRREGKEVYYKSADISETEFLHKMIEDLLEMICPE